MSARSPESHAPLTIGGLARQAQINPRTLRYYDRIGILQPSARSASGYRLYSSGDALRLAFIRRAQSLGLTLDEIGQILAIRDGGVAPCRHVSVLAREKIGEVDARIAELMALRADLYQLEHQARVVEAECAGSGAICLAFDA